MLLYLLCFLRATESNVCGDGELLYLKSACTKCSSFISRCTVCHEGDWLEIINGSFESPTVSSGSWGFFNSVLGWFTDYTAIEIINTYHSPYDGNVCAFNCCLSGEAI